MKRLSTRVTLFSGLLAGVLLGVFSVSVLLYNREGMQEQMEQELSRESGSLLAHMGSELEIHRDGIPARRQRQALGVMPSPNVKLF